MVVVFPDAGGEETPWWVLLIVLVGLLVLFVAAWVSLDRRLVLLSGVAALVWGVPHAIYPLFNPAGLAGSDLAASLLGLALFVVVGGSLLLFAVRAPQMVQGSDFKGTSRETLLLINNLILTVMAAMVLTGTLYPLLLDALDMGKISVGPPYFGLMFALLLIPIALFNIAGQLIGLIGNIGLGLSAFWLGVVPGGRIVVRGFNSLETVAAILAGLHVGAVVVPTMPLLRRPLPRASRASTT